MSEGNLPAMPQRRWWVTPLMAAAISFLACVLAFAVEQLCRFTLEPLSVEHVGLALLFGLLIGGMAFFVIVGPCQLLIALLGKWRRLKGKTIIVMMLIPAAFVVLSFLYLGVCWRDPANEVKRFVGITGAPWPTGAKMLLAEHGWGFQDRRHLWLFEGTPEQFYKLVRDRGWVLADDSATPGPSTWMPMKKAVQRFSKDSPWSAHEVYFWMADEVIKGPMGPGNLITDKEHRRWCVWWDAI